MKLLFLSSVVILPFQRLSGFRMNVLTLTRPSGAALTLTRPRGASHIRHRHFTNSAPLIGVSSTPHLAHLKIKMYNDNYNDYNDSPSYDNHKKPFFQGRKKKVRQDKCEAGRHKSQYAPRGFNQCRYVDFLKDPSVSIVVGVGPAGCGKTLFACHTAIQELKYGNIEKIVMTRPLVSVDKEDLGFLPGTIVNKMDPWTRPIFDIFSEFYSQNEIEYMIKTGVIEISPLAYMRGRTFKYSFIIADEMQNSSPNQMLMMTTRIGEGSKMVITGDLKQSDRYPVDNLRLSDRNGQGSKNPTTNVIGDLRSPETFGVSLDNNGLRDFIQKIQSFNGTNDDIRLVEMENSDIERSPVVIKVLEMYEPK